MDSKEKIISAEDLAQLKELRLKNALVATRAEKALLEARVSELEYKVAIQQVYLKYGISPDESVDENTGKVNTASEVLDG